MDCEFNGTTLAASLTVGGRRISFADIAGIYYRPDPLLGWDFAAGSDEANTSTPNSRRRTTASSPPSAAPSPTGPAVRTGLPTASHLLAGTLRESGFLIPPIRMADGGDGATEFFARNGRRVLASPPLFDQPRLPEGDEGEAILAGLSAKSGPLLAVPAGRWLRVLIVGGTPFAAWSESRELSDAAPMPSDFPARCRRLAERLDAELLELAFVRDDSGRDHCLRVNDLPSFEPRRAKFGPRVVEALADRLGGDAARDRAGRSV